MIDVTSNLPYANVLNLTKVSYLILIKLFSLAASSPVSPWYKASGVEKGLSLIESSALRQSFTISPYVTS